MRVRTLLDVAAVWGMRLAAVVVAPLLLFTARTWHGRAVGVFVGTSWFGFLGVVYLDACSAYLLPGPGRVTATPAPLVAVVHWVAVGMVLLLPFAFLWWCLSAAFLLFTQPAYRSDTPGLRSVFLGPLFLHRVQMMLLSEPDWLWLGTLLATRFDFRIKSAERRQIRDTVRHHLDELRDEHRVIPPALPLAVWGRIFHPDPGHLFAYRPEAADGERLGLLVFLHGHGGNALLYPHLLRPLADQLRCVVVCPSFGYGNWEHPHAALCVERAVRYAFEHFAEIDDGKVWLAGLSQGGAGVGRAAAEMPDTFAGLVFVSGTMEPDVLKDEAFAGRRVLVIHGDADRHVSLKSVEAGIDALRSAGADVTVYRHPAGTHFLLFAEPGEVFRRIGEWVK